MKKIFFILIAFLALSVQAVETKFGIGYINSDLKVNLLPDISTGSLELSYLVGYDNGLAAEVGVAFGVVDDDFSFGADTVTVEAKTSYYLRGIYNFNDTFFVNATWLDTEIGAEWTGNNFAALEAKESDSDLGYGIGANIALPNSEAVIRISYNSFDFGPADLDQISIKYLFWFLNKT